MKKICVVGAGAAGLAALRHIRENPNLQPVVFEQSNTIGGIWVYSEKVGVDSEGVPISSAMYKNLRTNLPQEIMGFLDFPVHKGTTSFVGHAQVLEYLHCYARTFKLFQDIQFNKRVTCVKPSEYHQEGTNCTSQNDSTQETTPRNTNKWIVTVQSSKDDSTTDYEFDVVIVCNGHFNQPFIPQIAGIDEFQGKLLHSRDYRTPEIFRDKRVVVLGCGPSGIDISVEISEYASQVYLSFRNPPRQGSFPQNLHQVHPIKQVKNNSIICEDKEEIECDVIVLCSGYLFDYRFLSPLCELTAVEGKLVTPLFRHMIHPKFPTLCFIGIPFQVCPFVMFDCQVRYYVKYLSDLIVLPSEEEMKLSIKDDERLRKMRGLPLSRSHQLDVFQWQYFQTLAEEADFLAKVNILRVVRKIYERVAQRRLQEPTIYKNDSVRIIDEETFLYVEAKE